jgi:hypothetical protein
MLSGDLDLEEATDMSQKRLYHERIGRNKKAIYVM